MVYLTKMYAALPHGSGFSLSLPVNSKVLLVLLSGVASWAKDSVCSTLWIYGVPYLKYSFVGDVDTWIRREENPLHERGGSGRTQRCDTSVRVLGGQLLLLLGLLSNLKADGRLLVNCAE